MSALSRDQKIAAVVRVSRWDKLSRSDFHDLLTPECEYLNMPLPQMKCSGPDQAYDQLSSFGNGWIMTELDVKHIACEGDIVLIERSERFKRTTDGTVVDLHSMGAFEFENGKMSRWRDYFDLTAIQAFFS